MVCAMLQLEVFTEDQVIIHEGEIGDKFYIVLSGKVDVLKKTVVQRKGVDSKHVKNTRVALLPANSTFGELALINSTPRACTCKALMRTACAILSKNDYQALLMQSDKQLLQTKLEALKKNSIFSGCSEKELMYISYFFKVIAIG